MEPAIRPLIQPADPRCSAPSLSQRLRTPVCVLVLATADVIGSFAAVSLAFLERTVVAEFTPLPTLDFISWVQMASLTAIAVLAGFLLRGMYLRHETFWEMIRPILTTLIRTIVIGIVVLFLLEVSTFASRTMIVLLATNLFLILPILRMTGVWILHRRGLWQRHVLLIAAPFA